MAGRLKPSDCHHGGKMARILAFNFFVLISLSTRSFAEVLNWDSRIPLSQGRAEYVCEVVTKYEAERKETANNCVLKKIQDFELTRIEFLAEKLSNFTVRSRLTLGGPICPSQTDVSCETNFKYLGPQDWEVEGNCF